MPADEAVCDDLVEGGRRSTGGHLGSGPDRGARRSPTLPGPMHEVDAAHCGGDEVMIPGQDLHPRAELAQAADNLRIMGM
jgi:hypothetical protein